MANSKSYLKKVISTVKLLFVQISDVSLGGTASVDLFIFKDLEPVFFVRAVCNLLVYIDT